VGDVAAVVVTGADWVMVVAVVVLVVASVMLALAETSLVRTSRARALALVEEGRRGARQLLDLVEHPEQFLSGVLLLVLVCQLVVATLVGILAERWFGGLGVAVATVFEVVVLFVVGEALPKNWAVQNPDRSALLAAPVVAVVVGFWPVRQVCRALVAAGELLSGPRRRPAAVSESELLAMADVAVEEQVIETEERALIHSIIEFGDTIVREVMVPRPEMRTVEASLSVDEALGVALAAGYSRLPAFEGNVDDIVGIAYVKDMVRADRAGHGQAQVRSCLRPAHFVPETKRVAALMREMQERTFHLAVVVDEYGGTAGLVTLEDLIEELVGEIVDEYDVEDPPIVALESGLSVSGRLTVDALNEELGATLPTGTWDTVGGLLFGTLGRVPRPGDAIEVAGHRLVADQVQGNRVGRVIVQPVAATGPGTSSADRSAPSTDRAAPSSETEQPVPGSGVRPTAGRSSVSPQRG
jgi:CBS domain containing-hemolysin-like protein